MGSTSCMEAPSHFYCYSTLHNCMIFQGKRAPDQLESSRRDEYCMIGTCNSLALNEGFQEEQIVPARYRQEFLTIAWDQALMSSNMQRQAVGWTSELVRSRQTGEMRHEMFGTSHAIHNPEIIVHGEQKASNNPSIGERSTDADDVSKQKFVCNFAKAAANIGQAMIEFKELMHVATSQFPEADELKKIISCVIDTLNINDSNHDPEDGVEHVEQ